MPKHAHVKPVREWLQSLAILTTVTMERNDAELRFAAYVSLLVDRFPDAAFTATSLEAVAARCPRGFPTYGELVTALAQWWRDNRPRPVPLPAPTVRREVQPPLTAEQIEQMHEAARTAIAALRASQDEPQATPTVQPRHLSPAQLDALNPLPNGYSRVAGRILDTSDRQADARQASKQRQDA